MFNKSLSVKSTIPFTAVSQTACCGMSRNSTYHSGFLQFCTTKPAKILKNGRVKYHATSYCFARSQTCKIHGKFKATNAA